ncbi:leucine-rich alpha-2-glycoprotein isoform X2 [Ictalurus punctatus]|nr:leucine-rich alpha-2-glycoprotein isoform X2 [Ictalurus punctatus]XP_017311160.1 leucine-rich alpha-2-glycoprotein isoform X2 [Ictalurus punctatus]XP_017311161.1 leucine-rich alpha-2-glycoprotein isoform X2 [Ictalurus punctatus]XP_017311162.1 leucine-rich alpha-2-glycoprotein isoform X2 [Ictalurus punctatus]XP_053531692.1 leucine-rich alpha-2-glycoprotein isoform X2 [Ictalurus punctatus]
MDSRGLLALALILWFRCYGALSCPVRCTCHFGIQSIEAVCPDAALSRYPSDGLPGNTTSLTIQFTNLSSVSAHELGATPLLQELHLPGNTLSSLPEDLLSGLYYLHTIDLTGNQLKELPARVFYHAPLLNLVLKDNRLTSVDVDWLPTNSNLTWLDLSGNKLRKIPSALLQRLSHLETLHLSQNLLEALPAESLHSLYALERLHLEDNKLHFLDAKAFSHNTNLTHLFLQRNKLQSLPGTVFHGLDRLQYLDLSENQLTFLTPGTLGLRSSWVELTFNPWHCDAKIEYLWKRLNNMAVQSEVKCASPETLKDKALAALTRKELGLTD